MSIWSRAVINGISENLEAPACIGCITVQDPTKENYYKRGEYSIFG